MENGNSFTMIAKYRYLKLYICSGISSVHFNVTCGIYPLSSKDFYLLRVCCSKSAGCKQINTAPYIWDRQLRWLSNVSFYALEYGRVHIGTRSNCCVFPIFIGYYINTLTLDSLLYNLPSTISPCNLHACAIFSVRFWHWVIYQPCNCTPSCVFDPSWIRLITALRLTSMWNAVVDQHHAFHQWVLNQCHCKKVHIPGT